jgi:hypothetical protein
VATNKKPLDMLVEASQRPRCYFPSPSLLDRERESLVAMLLPGVQGVREAGRSLPVRAMWHLGEGRLNEAWKDLLAVHRIGRLTAQGQTLVEQLVGIAIDGLAREGTLTLLDQAFPTAKFIVVYRESLAEQYVSQVLAQATQQWLLAPGEQQRQTQVVIEPASLRWFCEQTRAAYRTLLAHPGLMEKAVLLSYEELTAEAKRCLNERICPLLGLPASAATARTRKQNTQHFTQRVANYAKVAELLASPLCQQRHAWPAKSATGREAA